MKTITTHKVWTPIPLAILTVLLALVMIAPINAQAANDNDRRDRHYNPYVAQSIVSHLERFEERFGWLPPGLQRLLERFEAYLPEEDEDTTAPTLVDATVTSDITSATLALEADEDARAKVWVGTESGFGINDDGVIKLVDNDYELEHSFAIEDLEADTEYFYKVRLIDEEKNKSWSDEMSFVTKDEDDETDETLPEVLSLEVTPDMNSADITIEFDEATEVRLFVSPTDGFERTDDDVMVMTHDEFMTEHMFTIDELESDTEYFYRVHYRDEDGNRHLSDQMSFVTGTPEEDEDTTHPEVLSLETHPSTSTVQVLVELDEPSDVRLFVSPTENFNRNDDDVITMTSYGLMTEHEFVVEGLESDTQYYYRISYRDEHKNNHLGEYMSFMTEAEVIDEDTEAPVISDVAGVASTTSIMGSWETNEPATSVLYTSTDNGFALDDSGVIVTEDTTLKSSHNLTITGLTADTTYYHRIVTEDEAGNETVSEQYTLGTSS